MNLTEEQNRNQELLGRIITEAWKNETFKKSLMSDPKSTLETFLGEKLKTTKGIKVIDQTDSEYLYINIPAKPNLEDMELNEEQLELVAGGAEPGFWDYVKVAVLTSVGLL